MQGNFLKGMDAGLLNFVLLESAKTSCSEGEEQGSSRKEIQSFLPIYVIVEGRDREAADKILIVWW